jgi:hypothetical protein
MDRTKRSSTTKRRNRTLPGNKKSTKKNGFVVVRKGHQLKKHHKRKHNVSSSSSSSKSSYKCEDECNNNYQEHCHSDYESNYSYKSCDCNLNDCDPCNPCPPCPPGPKGDKGDQGPAVDGGGVMPYEPYNHHILLSEWPLTNKWIFYTQFIAPTNGDYTNLTFFTTPSSTPTYTGTLAVGIYTNTGNNPGSPNTRIASGTLSFSNADMDKKFIDITFTSPATLVANAFYWISISGEHDSGELVYLGFHNDYNGAYDTVKYQTSGFSASGGLPSTTSSLLDGEYAYWFRLYNPNAGLGAGAKGDTGAQGQAGTTVYDFAIACSDETSVLAVNSSVSFHTPQAFRLIAVSAGLTTKGGTGNTTVNLSIGGKVVGPAQITLTGTDTYKAIPPGEGVDIPAGTPISLSISAADQNDRGLKYYLKGTIS